MDDRACTFPRNLWVVTLTRFLTAISSEMLAWLLPSSFATCSRRGPRPLA